MSMLRYVQEREGGLRVRIRMKLIVWLQVEWRKNKAGYIQKCKKLVERANKEKPAHVVIPHPDTDENEHRRSIFIVLCDLFYVI